MGCMGRILRRRLASFPGFHLICPHPMWALIKEFLLFLRQEKKWWLLPLVVILLAMGALMVISSGSVLSPFLYPLM